MTELRFKAENFEAVATVIGPARPSYEGVELIVESPGGSPRSVRFVGRHSGPSGERIEFLTDRGWAELCRASTTNGLQSAKLSLADAISLLYSVPGVGAVE